jgi:hypothetical protein
VPLKISKHQTDWGISNGYKLSILPIAQKAAKSLKLHTRRTCRGSACTSTETLLTIQLQCVGSQVTSFKRFGAGGFEP